MATVRIQSGRVEVEIGRRYHVVIRSVTFGNSEFDGTLTGINHIDTTPIMDPFSDAPPPAKRGFDFLSFEQTTLDRWPGDGRGARDFTIASMKELR